VLLALLLALLTLFELGLGHGRTVCSSGSA
jgi:hypothetical protein